MKQITISSLQALKSAGEKIAVLTAYDASIAALAEEAGVEVILVGDSLGMVIQGHDSTLPVSIGQMAYHTSCVARGMARALLIADLPFMTYADRSQAVASARRLMQAGAQMIKLEGGDAVLDVVTALSDQGAPVCAHLGLIPQSVHRLGGYKVQGRGEQAADELLQQATRLERAGAQLLVLECIPTNLAQTITAAVNMPVIGIGAGVHCDGQVLVCYDMLGISKGKRPKFSKNFLAENNSVAAAISAYVQAVKEHTFPADEHSFNS